MEQVLATINYFIREKLWCSIRRLCDLVGTDQDTLTVMVTIGDEEGS